ncbi:hypothetical protein D3C85_1903060 [compost metagenome]
MRIGSMQFIEGHLIILLHILVNAEYQMINMDFQSRSNFTFYEIVRIGSSEELRLRHAVFL